MSETQHFMENKRKSFRLASPAQGLDQMASYAKMGREYIQRARAAAEIVDVGFSPSLRPKTGKVGR
jgi:hypothetical protein